MPDQPRPVPPYRIRKQLREATLAIGRTPPLRYHVVRCSFCAAEHYHVIHHTLAIGRVMMGDEHLTTVSAWSTKRDAQRDADRRNRQIQTATAS
jgi:hypothetical protein